MTDSTTSLIVELRTQALKYTTEYREWAEATIKALLALPGAEEKVWVENHYVLSRKLETVECPDCWYVFEDCYKKSILGSIANYKIAELAPANCLVDPDNLLEKLSYIETKLKEKINQGTRGTGDKQSGQLAITQKEKTEHPLITRYDEAISTVWEYIDTLFVYSENQKYLPCGKLGEIYRTTPKDVKIRSDIKDDRFPGLIYVELKSGEVVGLLPHSHRVFMMGKLLPPEETANKLQSLSNEVLKIYRSLQPDLGLNYEWKYLAWPLLDFKDKDGSLWDKLRKIAWKLQELRDREQWELEKQSLTNTNQGKETPPQAGPAEDKLAYQWKFDSERNEVRCNSKQSVKLEPRLFELFKYLNGKKNKKTGLEKINTDLQTGKGYRHLVGNRLNKLISTLDKKAKVLGLREGEIKSIIEKHKNKKVLKAVTFHAK